MNQAIKQVIQISITEWKGNKIFEIMYSLISLSSTIIQYHYVQTPQVEPNQQRLGQFTNIVCETYTW